MIWRTAVPVLLHRPETASFLMIWLPSGLRVPRKVRGGVVGILYGAVTEAGL
jgi:hypothetical protein